MTEPVIDPRYVAARRILLDAPEALAPNGAAFTVVGAQAIYLHTGAAELDRTVAPYTTDGDLVVNPSLLGDDPLLETAMRGSTSARNLAGTSSQESGSPPPTLAASRTSRRGRGQPP